MIAPLPKGTAGQAKILIAETARETKSHAARLAMAKLASGPLANLTDEAKALWADYHRRGAPEGESVA